VPDASDVDRKRDWTGREAMTLPSGPLQNEATTIDRTTAGFSKTACLYSFY